MNVALEPVARGPFDGVLQIVRYNWNLYLAAVAGSIVILALVALVHPPVTLGAILIAGALIGVFWLLASLAVSHYVYDRSELYDWTWIADRLGLRPRRLVIVHAGLDEVSPALRRLYPDSDLTILDIYNSREMPEPSIARARAQMRPSAGTLTANYRNLPVLSGTADAVFVIFTAHELRRALAREAFFREAFRVLSPGGCLLLVEHLRDAWNLAAFGPGALHFFGRAEWLRVTRAAGFKARAELSCTPFVRAFVFRPG